MYTNKKFTEKLSEAKQMALTREFKNELISSLELPKAFDNLSLVEQQKQKLYKELVVLGETVFSSENPRFFARKFLMDNLFKLSSLEVLYPNDKIQQLQVSGELFPYLKQIIVKNPSLAPFFQSFELKSNSTEEEYLNALLGTMFILGLWNKSTKTILNLLEDTPGENEQDWTAPCYNSFCIAHEYAYRKELNLPQLSNDENFSTEVRLHAAWLEVVEQNHDNLREKWGQLWFNVTGSDDPFKAIGF